VSSQDEIPTVVGIFSNDQDEDEGLEEIPFGEARVWLTEEQKRVAYSKVSEGQYSKQRHMLIIFRCS
jgi:hypothetical protein